MVGRDAVAVSHLLKELPIFAFLPSMNNAMFV